MTAFTRRQFLELSAKMSVVLGLSSSTIPKVAEALEALATGRSKVLWLQAQSCSGCSISMLDSESPGPAELLTQYISLLFHHTLSAATGESCMQIVQRSVQQGGYILVVEGSIPAGMPEACMMGGTPIGDLIQQAAERADYVVALGTCAAFGGIPAAEGNPTGSVPVGPFLLDNKINTPTINIPGCPSHPDWLVGTLVHLSKFGLPPCDEQKRPKMFFATKNHDKCPRFSDYEQENFARKFSDPGCLFKLGCLGVNTHADCTIRDRNGGTNACIKSGAPCIGCSSPQFAQKKSLPFYRKSEQSYETTY